MSGWSMLWVTLVVGPPAMAEAPLAFGTTVQAEVGPSAPTTFEVDAPEGAVLHLRIDHPHLEFTVRLSGPDGAQLGEESVSASTEPVTLTGIAARAGAQRIKMVLREGTRGGRFQLMLAPAHAANETDRARIEAERLRREADLIGDRNESAQYSRALELYDRSAARFGQIQDPFEQAATLVRATYLLEQMNRLEEAHARLERALPLWREAADRAGESRCLEELGLVVAEQGDPRAALELYSQALALRRELGPLPYAEGRIVTGMAIALNMLGRKPEAIARYTEALELARKDGDRSVQAVTLKNRANQYLDLGETERGLRDLQEAGAQFRALGDIRAEGITELSIGIAWKGLGRRDLAWSSFQRALPLLERTRAARFAAVTLENMGLLRLDERRWAEASRLFDQALSRISGEGDRRTTAILETDRARVLAATGQADQARARLIWTVSELHAIGDRSLEADSLYHLATVELGLGRLEEARDHTRAAVRVTEETRQSIQGSSSRSAWIAKDHPKYELLVEVLLALHAREPDRGWDVAALEVSETARARALLDVLTGARVDVRSGVGPSLLEAEKALDARAEHARRALVAVLGREHRSEEADAVERELESLGREREELEARMRASSPRYAALAPGAPLSLAEIREKVLDASTTLVDYMVGRDRSFVWVVSRTRVRSAVLPGRKQIEDAVKAVVRRWSDPLAPDDAPGPAAALSRMVLGPVAGALQGERLLVVADGPLQQVPFAALPSPERGRALLDTYTVVNSPSASVLAALRTTSVPAPGGLELAVLADPVVGDGRRSELGPLVRSLEDAGLRHLEPLPGSRREALAIASHLPRDRVLTAFGAEASRETAMGAEVARARIVHFATHALLDIRRPELSGIVLSERDSAGTPKNGFLSLADISAMKLSAELVVLSACRTGLGKDVRGEGLVGLTRGFMNAGAPRVVASLWKVSDTATAALMSGFYTELLDHHLPPADALRAAQRAVRRERRTSAPHAWAGFVLEGDWRPFSTTPAELR